MKTISINGSSRGTVGKKEAKAIRSEGKVPCVLYGGKEQVNFTALEKDFKHLVYTPDVHTVKLDIEGRQFDAIMQDIQLHPVSDKILHVDFIEVIENKPLIMNIPVQITGTSPGVRAGGKLIKKQNKLRVRGLISQMPQAIKVSIESLEIGQSIRVGDLSVEGLTFLDSPNVTVITVKMTRNVVEDKSAAPAAGAKTAAKAPAAAAKAEPKKDAKK